jgi:arabinogalactan endo-1,4-beta-galactosidase
MGNREEERDESKVRREEEAETRKEVQNCNGVLNSQGVALVKVRVWVRGSGEENVKKESGLISTT